MNGIKQSTLADTLGVAQGTVSRWEHGTHAPDDQQERRIAQLIGANAQNQGDHALIRLVTTSPLPVHLVCDTTHRLLAASPSRASEWQVPLDELLDQPMWQFATPDIVQAELALEDAGWFDRTFRCHRFVTQGNDCTEVPVPPSLVLWESVPLAKGHVGRLTTTLRYLE